MDDNANMQADGAGKPTDVQPEESALDMTALKEELDRAQASSKEYFEGWQRERADFLNYKKRIERDQQMLNQNLTASVVKKYLVVIDDLERALLNRPTGGDEVDKWVAGIELIYRKLQSILESEGVERIPAEQEEFDPSRHEAISYEKSPDHSSNEIIEVVQQGYHIGDRIIRPAIVRVAQ